MKKTFLNLGKHPIANGFLTEPINNEYKYDLKVCFDTNTKLITLCNYVDPPLMFNEYYAYRGSMSKTMVNHFKNISKELQETIKGSKILEIGSNDGVFLKNWPRQTTIAVEPCNNFAEETNNMDYRTYNEFWDNVCAERIINHHGHQDIVFAANCICHIPDLDETFSAIEKVLSNDGVFIFEDPSLAEMINRNSYDQIYDEHAHIFSVTALNSILKKLIFTV